MGIIMNRTKLFFGIAVSISGLFASQTFAASCSITSACDPAAAAAACEPACDPISTACDPVSEACDPGCAPACVTPATCDPAAAAACNSGGRSAAPGCNTGCNAGCNTGCNSTGSRCGSFSAFGNNGCGICDPCAPRGCADAFFGKLKKSICDDFCWSGYMNAGYDTNFRGNRSNGYIDCWNNTTPAFNALYISGVKKAHTDGCGYDIGFGVDFMFGEDSRIFRSARGLDQNWYTGHMYNPVSGDYDKPSYGFAMPQLYLEAAINYWTVKLGHFYSLLGYEGATADSRFFYTKGIICQLTPVSQTGVLTSFNGFENLDVTVGWVNGLNNGFDNSEYNEGMVTGAFTYHINNCAYVKYAFLAGTADLGGFFGLNLFPHMKSTGSIHNFILDLKLTRYLESVSLLYYSDFGGITNLALGQHLYYDLNCCAKAGFRAEWMKNTFMGLETELTTLALGLNLHPNGIQNLYIRPELRYDHASGMLGSMMLNGNSDQLTIGFDVMMTF